MNKNVMNLLSEQKIFPIIRTDDVQTARDRVRAVMDAGLKTVEINLEKPEIYEIIYEFSDQINICAGGIITSLQAYMALDAGARLLSSPIFHMNLVKLSKDKHIPYIAGTSTANEAYEAWKLRIPVVKIYPVTALGGTLYIKDLLRPMPFLRVIPQGCVKLSEVKSYIDAGAYAVGVGRDLFEDCSYSQATEQLKKVMAEI